MPKHEQRAREIAVALMVRYPSMGPSGVGLDPMDVVRAALPALAAVEREALERAATVALGHAILCAGNGPKYRAEQEGAEAVEAKIRALIGAPDA